MGQDYSYSQPSQSEDLFCNSVDSVNSDGYSETEALIRQDQAELGFQDRSSVQYPPQPVCYCGAQPLLVAVMEEMRGRDRHVLDLAEKVQNLTLSLESNTEQRMNRLEFLVGSLNTRDSFDTTRFEFWLVVVVLVLVFLVPCLVLWAL